MATTIHKGHNIANMALNAVTIGVESSEATNESLGDIQNDRTVDHQIVYSVRVHTAYINDGHKQQATIELMDAIVTKMKKNINLSSDYRLIGVSPQALREEFTESATKGGQVNIMLRSTRIYTQE